MLTTLRRPWAVWLALCMTLLGALAPTVSHALVRAQGGPTPLIEICTSAGPRWMALAAQADVAGVRPEGGVINATTPLAAEPDPSSPTPSPATVWEHCPFCLLMADRLAPPPPHLLVCVAASGHAGVPVLPPAVLLPAQVLAAAHPRGPPAL